MSLPRFEYARFRVGVDRSLVELNKIGALGWRLVCLDGADGIFCRDATAAALAAIGDQQAAEQVREVLG